MPAALRAAALLACACASLAPALAQNHEQKADATPPYIELKVPDRTLPMTSLGIDAHTIASKKSMGDDYRTWWGSYDKSFTRYRVVQVGVRTTGKKETVNVRTWWIGKPIDSNRKFILLERTRRLTVEGGKPVVFEDDSGDVTGTDFKLATIGYRTTSGAKIDGWLVAILNDEGNPLRTAASDPYLLPLLTPQNGEYPLTKLKKAQQQQQAPPARP